VLAYINHYHSLVIFSDLEEAETTSFQTSLKKSIESGLFVVKSDGKPIALSDKPSKTIKTLADLKKQSEPVQVVSVCSLVVFLVACQITFRDILSLI